MDKIESKEQEFAKKLLKLCDYKAHISGKAFDFSNDKQLMYYLEKWELKDWWESGVSTRTGWFTDKGIEHFKELLNG